jgi:carbamoyl-phosphate synthase small subunit
MRGALSSVNTDGDRLIELARSSPSMNGADLVRFVSCAQPQHLQPEDAWQWNSEQWYQVSRVKSPSSNLHAVVCDYGIKTNTLRWLTTRGCRVTIVPASASAEEISALCPDGVLLSNGPGDPAAVSYAIDTVRTLLGRVPILGICLGHQILGLALGGDTYKLKFGHRGANQPVKNLLTGRVVMSTHNHGFAVRAESLPRSVEVTHVNLNDQCVEGLQSRDHRAFGVQYHPEAAPGPHDATDLLDEFIATMQAQSL